ncbi:unnamed protein product [Paramecium pentaurelia]|uniref:ADF-H domain-containing protein n=1 Tax=Paramecium pentaurelia TaxID=43138 RepID=A0A8S1WHD4_9CILI|nr:unnamed protein product [Paramecium pentaurelia]
MNVGTHVSDDCVTEFNKLKLGKQYRYLTFKLNNDTNEIVVDHVGERDSTYAEFVSHLQNESRYAVYDYHAQTDDVPPRQVEKLVFIFWSPDANQPVKQKMSYAAGKEALKKKLNGLSKEIQANDPSEVEEAEMRKLVLN